MTIPHNNESKIKAKGKQKINTEKQWDG